MAEITRFAPSPTGRLHIGHVYSALFAQHMGRMLLRIEDIDHARCRESYASAIIEDLALLGMHHPNPMRQSKRLAVYAKAIARLHAIEMLYPCFCTRSEITLAAHHTRPNNYPGTCKHLSGNERQARIASGKPYALRLHTERAQQRVGELYFTDLRIHHRIEVDYGLVGDPVIARKELTTSYHLACVVDDAAQGITLVTRGEDLLDACHTQRLLQALLDLPCPRYCHHPLLVDGDNQRLAKRTEASSFAALLANNSITLQQLYRDFSRWLTANGLSIAPT